MLVKPEELQIGDEILVSYGANLVYARILAEPKLSGKTTYYGIPRYKNTRCSCRVDTVILQHPGSPYTYHKKQYVCTPDDHNVVKHFDFTEKNIWLVRRK